MSTNKNGFYCEGDDGPCVVQCRACEKLVQTENEVMRLMRELDETETKLDTVSEALRKLTNEIDGLCGVYPGSLESIAGRTNISVLMTRIGEARAALADHAVERRGPDCNCAWHSTDDPDRPMRCPMCGKTDAEFDEEERGPTDEDLRREVNRIWRHMAGEDTDSEERGHHCDYCGQDFDELPHDDCPYNECDDHNWQGNGPCPKCTGHTDRVLSEQTPGYFECNCSANPCRCGGVRA